MMGSPMVLFVLIPLMIFSKIFLDIGAFFGIDVEGTFASFLEWFHSPEVTETLESLGMAVEDFIINYFS